MLFLLASLAAISSPLTYRQARELAFQTPYALNAERRGYDVAAHKSQRDGDGWTFRLVARRNCGAQSCLLGWVHVDRVTGAISDPVAEKSIRTAHLGQLETAMGR